MYIVLRDISFLRFNPRSPRGGATFYLFYYCSQVGGFQSTLPTRGSDIFISCVFLSSTSFNPRSPRGGATFSYRLSTHIDSRFNPRSPRGGATKRLCGGWLHSPVSIHAPHEGERPNQCRKSGRSREFQSTLPTRGSDDPSVALMIAGDWFQSTLPTRGSDAPVASFSTDGYSVSIHAPHEGERRDYKAKGGLKIMFQSTLPTRGSDRLSCPVSAVSVGFQSTLPTRGSDQIPLPSSLPNLCFNPRSPRGGATHFATCHHS